VVPTVRADGSELAVRIEVAIERLDEHDRVFVPRVAPA
jgi:hypothetical protein